MFGILDKKYCYDIGTNNIMRINDVLFDVLQIYNYANQKEVLEQLRSKYPEKDLLDSIETIEDFNKNKGGFILEKKILLHFPITRNQYGFLAEHFLRHLVLNITEQCNLRCKYCIYGETYRYSRKHSGKSMSWKTIKKAVDFFIARCQLRLKEPGNTVTIGFYGGEPFLEHNNIFKAVQYIKTEYPEVFDKIEFRATTNGTLLNEEIIRNLILYKFKLVFSLDGPEDMHDRNRVFQNGTGSYRRVQENLETIKCIDPEYLGSISFSTVMTPEFDIPRMLKYFTETHAGHNSFNFTDASPHDTSYFDGFDMVEEKKKLRYQTQKLRIEYLQKKSKRENDKVLSSFLQEDYLNIHHRKLFPMPDKTYHNGCCLPGVKRLFVDVDGNFHACERIDEHHRFGNLDSGFDVEKIFDMFDQYAESNNNCQGCWAIRFCNNCFITSIKNDEYSKERKASSCESFRESLLPRLQSYIHLVNSIPHIFDEPFEGGVDDLTEVMGYLEKYYRN